MSTLLVKRLTETAKLPTRAHPDDAGLDIYSDVDLVIRSGNTVAVSTGIALSPSAEGKTLVCLVWDKSGIGLKGVKTLGGVIDQSYRGELMVILHALDEDYVIKHGQKLCNLIVQSVEIPTLVEVVDFPTVTVRGSGGFGSTGS